MTESNRRTLDRINALADKAQKLNTDQTNGIFTGGLTVAGNSTLTGDVTQVGDYILTGNMYQTGDYIVTGNINITGSLNTYGQAIIYNEGKDTDDGILIVRNDSSTVAGDLLGGIGFDSTDGNVPSSITEASAYIASYAAENHTPGDKGGYLVFGTTAIDENDDTTSHERMRIDSAGTVTFGTSDGAGKHIISAEIDLRLADDSDRAIIAEIPNVKIPGKSIINRVVAIMKTRSNLNVLDVHIELSNTTGTTGPTNLVPGGYGEILGAGESTTDSTDSSSATSSALQFLDSDALLRPKGEPPRPPISECEQ